MGLLPQHEVVKGVDKPEVWLVLTVEAEKAGLMLDALLQEHVPGAHSARRTYETVVAKVDVEGSECNVFESGQQLFTRLKADFVQVELLRPDVQECAHRQAGLHGSVIGTRRGHDNNTVLWRSRHVRAGRTAARLARV